MPDVVVPKPAFDLGISDGLDSAPFALRTGGPDAYGYTFADSAEPTGPAFNWIDISGASATPGTSVTAARSDDGVGTANPIGFSFNFYGTNYTTINIGANGAASFTATSIGFTNATIPTAAAPNQIVAPLWDDFHLGVNQSPNAEIRYLTTGTAPNRQLVISWIKARPYCSTATATTPCPGAEQTFQAILYEGTNNIRYQYLTVSGVSTTSSTVGIEGTGAVGQGLLVEFNDTPVAGYVQNSLAIQFTSPPPPPPNVTFTSAAMVTQQTGLVTADGTSLYFASTENIVIGGTIGTLPVTSATFTIGGTINPADIAEARLFYTGSANTAPTLSSPTLGPALLNPGGTITFTGSQAVSPGNNYFWLVLAFKTTAAPAATVSNTFTSVTVGGTAYAPSPGTLGNVLTIATPPVNNDLARAKVIAAVPYSDSQTNVGATPETGELGASCIFGGIANDTGNSIWYSYTPSASGPMTVTAGGYDNVLAVYTGTAFPLTQVACADDNAATPAESITYTVTAGVRYSIRIAGYGGNSGTTAVTLTGPAPLVSQQLSNGAGYRLLSTPVSGVTVGTLADINLVQGVVGQYPGGTSTIVANLLLSLDASGYVKATNIANTVAPGAGFFWYFYDINFVPPTDVAANGGGTSRSYTLATRPLATTGTPVTTNTSVTFPASGSNTYHMAGNPFATSMTADGVTGDVAIQNDIQVYNPAGTFTTLPRTAATRLSTWQGFFVEQMTAGTALTVTYDASKRVSGNGTIVGRAAETQSIALALTGLTADGTAVIDEAARVRVSDVATDGWDADDASKLTPPTDVYALLAPVGTRNGADYRQAILSTPDADALVTLAFKATTAGTYTVTAEAMGYPEGTAVEIRDLVTGTVVTIGEGYTFTSPATDWTSRFVVRAKTGGATAGEPGATAEFALAAPSPNPTTGAATVTFDVPAAADVSVSVYDLLGRRVAVLAEGQVTAGRHTSRLDAGALAPGVYVVRMQSGTFMATQRVTVVR